MCWAILVQSSRLAPQRLKRLRCSCLACCQRSFQAAQRGLGALRCFGRL